MQALHINKRRKFISTKLKKFCDKRNIKIKYTAFYIYEENGIAEQGFKTIITIKNLLLIDSGLPLKFWTDGMDIICYL